MFSRQKTGKIVEITKLCCLGAIVCVLILSYLLLLPDVGIYILIAGAFLGLFALGVFPLALELTVEATFPCDQVGVMVTTQDLAFAKEPKMSHNRIQKNSSIVQYGGQITPCQN